MGMPDILWEVHERFPLTVTLKVGADGFLGVHFVFKLLLVLFLKEITVVPFPDFRVRDHSVGT